MCRDLFTNHIFYFQSVCAKTRFPQIWVIFSKRPAGFRCCKRPSPTFANIWSHYPWTLQRAFTVYLNINTFLKTFDAAFIEKIERFHFTSCFVYFYMDVYRKWAFMVDTKYCKISNHRNSYLINIYYISEGVLWYYDQQ